MKLFADLLKALAFTPGRNAKLAHLTRYFATAGDPDRGWALAAITGELKLKTAQPALIRRLAEERVDPVLFRLSYDYVGDLAETIALIWPNAALSAKSPPPLSAVVETLRDATKLDAPAILTNLLDRLEPDARLALIKLATGGLRVGVSARLAKTALSRYAQEREVKAASLDALEELWHGLEPPYASLFAWLDGDAPQPQVDGRLGFRPMMLAHPLDAALFSADDRRGAQAVDDETLERLKERFNPSDFIAEWKWDGVRVQAAAADGETRLYSRHGEDIGDAFPDIREAMRFNGCVDGELLIKRDGDILSFGELQKRLNRKTASAKLIRESPAHIRVYDILHDGEQDLRSLSYAERSMRLTQWMSTVAAPKFDISEPIPFDDWSALAALRSDARAASQEGLMLKRKDGRYEGGRPMGQWFKWKRSPLSADCVLMYAQRGHGKRSSFFSDYTFGVWRRSEEGRSLTPVGKAYSGYTDEELKRLDKWIRDNTTDRYGPVRAVAPGLVFEVAFDAIQESTRHKSGLAMRFPRIKSIRWDKPSEEADTLDGLKQLLQ